MEETDTSLFLSFQSKRPSFEPSDSITVTYKTHVYTQMQKSFQPVFSTGEKNKIRESWLMATRKHNHVIQRQLHLQDPISHQQQNKCSRI